VGHAEGMTDCRSGFLPTPQGVLATFAMLPVSRPLRGIVVLCPPLFEERKACATVFTALAQQISANGFGVLRFDPRCTGESPGAFRDGTVTAWCEDTDAVIAFARRTGVPVILLGIRFGALLAVSALQFASVDAIVLWEPIADGAEALRQAVQRKRVNDMAAFGVSEASRLDLDTAWDRGEDVDLDGYLVSAVLRRELLVLSPDPIPSRCPVLLVQIRPGRTADAAAARLCPSAERTICATPSFWSSVGILDVSQPVREISDWLAMRFDAGQGGLEQGGHVWDLHFPGSASPESTASGPTVVTLESVRGTPLQAVWLQPAPAPRLKVLFLAGWSGCRLGPHNVFVELARRLEREGIASLRLDYGGRGDSLGDAAATTIQSMAEDARTALQWMRLQDDPEVPCALVAICSGCKVAVSVASEEPDLRLLALWSPEPMGALRPSDTNRRKSRSMLHAYVIKALRRETWSKLLRGGIQGRMVGRALLRHETRGLGEARIEDAVLAKFPSFQGRILCVFGEGDPEAKGSETAYSAYFRQHGISCDRRWIARAGHSFYRSDWADALMAQTCDWLKACL